MPVQSKLKILDFPDDGLYNILARCSPLDVIAFRQTCRRAHELTTKRFLWIEAARIRSTFLPDRPLESFDGRELERLLVLDENWQNPSPRSRTSRYLLSPYTDITYMELYHGRYMLVTSRSSLSLYDVEKPEDELKEPLFHQFEPRCKYFFSSHRGPVGRSNSYGDVHIPMIKRKYPTHDSVVIWRLQPTQDPPLLQIAELSAPPLDDIPSVCISNGLVLSHHGKTLDEPRLIPTIYDIASQRTYRFHHEDGNAWYSNNQHYFEYLPEIGTILLTHTNERGSLTGPPAREDPSFIAYRFPPPGNEDTLTRTHFNLDTFPRALSEPAVISHERLTLPSGVSMKKLTLVGVCHPLGAPHPIQVRTFNIFLPLNHPYVLFDIPETTSTEHSNLDSDIALSMFHSITVTPNRTGRARVVARTHRLGRLNGSSGEIVLYHVDSDGETTTPVHLSDGNVLISPSYLFDGFRGRLVCPYPSYLNIVDFV
ncbi:hypothetical protein V5O48_001602 [Marasmius crinis-equi]|uniref:F-box domain-containing protein n=1 Tax=Marasmius crinis-equi TaxID=585013 RepID=A0ABR3FY41_9AGAR